MTIRQGISSVRTSLKEVNADSRLTNKAIYDKLLSSAKLIIMREANALRLTYLTEAYQVYTCLSVEDLPWDDSCIGIPVKKKFYRSVNKIPDTFIDTKGAIIRGITSLDGSTVINYTDEKSVIRSLKDSNSKYDKSVYGFLKEGYIYLTRKIPVEISGFFITNLNHNPCCKKEDDCTPFLDQEWKMPQQLIDPIISKVISDLSGTYKRIPEQININKDPNT